MASWQEVIEQAKAKAFRGGVAGGVAMCSQIGSLMWLRTIMNYQYRHGTSIRDATRQIYLSGRHTPVLGSAGLGGVARFYRGVLPALVQGPMARFGDTAANAGALALLDGSETTKSLPVSVKTAFGSLAAASMRVALMPIDAVKTCLQVEGSLGTLKARMRATGPVALFHGSVGAASATFVGHYPWFATYNYLQSEVPVPVNSVGKLARNAGIGFCASIVSDTTSNSLRVLKTYRQTSDIKVSYPEAAKRIIATEGYSGLFGRGLKVRLVANGLQGMMFSVVWKEVEARLSR